VPGHRKRLGELWAGFADVAARNPHAAIRRRYRPDELTTVGPRNRMVSYPYPKLLCANNSVDQAAALLVCSVQRATDLGIPTDRWVFPWSGAQGNEPPMSRRYDLAASPAIRIAGRRASLLAGITVDDIEHVDIYSCFPSAVQIAANELELCAGRELTVTGGLTFAGGPWSNYTTHAIATMTTLLRESPNAIGMCTANGGVLTKHAIGVYSASPPRIAFRSTDVQDEIDREPARRITPEVEGSATLEAFTVRVDRDGQPTEAYMSALRADGCRVWTSSRRADLITELIDDDRAERHLRIGHDGTVELGT
jgi:acetyl-CoA C-acetyltransferase